jgi:aquaporin Z
MATLQLSQRRHGWCAITAQVKRPITVACVSSGGNMSKKLIAEALGTLILVLFGCGSAVIAGADIGLTGISLAFGLAIVAAAYGLGAISGAHLNPAVSLGMVTAGRMSVGDFIGYAIAQCAGALAGAAILLVIASGKADYTIATNGLGQNGYGAGYLGEYSLMAALVFEGVMTFIFVTVILGATASGAPGAMAGLAIGLTLAAIHLVGINVTGVSVNPARSFGPAVLVGGKALADLWVFIVAPLAGGAVAGLVYAMGLTRAD